MWGAIAWNPLPGGTAADARRPVPPAAPPRTVASMMLMGLPFLALALSDALPRAVVVSRSRRRGGCRHLVAHPVRSGERLQRDVACLTPLAGVQVPGRAGDQAMWGADRRSSWSAAAFATRPRLESIKNAPFDADLHLVMMKLPSWTGSAPATAPRIYLCRAADGRRPVRPAHDIQPDLVPPHHVQMLERPVLVEWRDPTGVAHCCDGDRRGARWIVLRLTGPAEGHRNRQVASPGGGMRALPPAP